MDNLISLVNKIQRACTALGDHGESSALPTLWDSLPAIAVVGGQVIFLSDPYLLFSRFFSFLIFIFSFRVLESPPSWKALSAKISYLVDQVVIDIDFSPLYLGSVLIVNL
jgi:hypothetical protein